MNITNIVDVSVAALSLISIVITFGLIIFAWGFTRGAVFIYEYNFTRSKFFHVLNVISIVGWLLVCEYFDLKYNTFLTIAATVAIYGYMAYGWKLSKA